MVNEVDDIFRCSAQTLHTETTDLGLNVFSLQMTSLTSDDSDDIVTDLKEYVDAFFNALISNISSEYSGGELEGLNFSKGELIGNETLTWAGTTTPDALPPTVAALIIGHTAVPRVQGRKYILGIDQEAENTGRWTAAAMTQFNLGKDAYIASFIGSSGNVYKPGVIKDMLGTPAWEPFTTGKTIVNNRTMRSRTIGRGM